MMPILAVHNFKGGSSKTTTCIDLAAVWSMKGKRVALLDVDPQSSTSRTFLGSAAHAITTRDVLLDNVPVEDGLKSAGACLWVLPCDKTLKDLAAQLPNLGAADVRLSRALRQLDGFDIVILDCAGSFDVITRNAVAAATHLLVPLNTERTAFDNALDTITHASNLREMLEKDPLPFRVALTSFKARTINGATIESAALAQWPTELLQTRVRLTEKIREQAARSETVRDSPGGTAREDYTALADELALLIRF